MTQEERENQNSPLTDEERKSVVKIFPSKKMVDPVDFKRRVLLKIQGKNDSNFTQAI